MKNGKRNYIYNINGTLTITGTKTIVYQKGLMQGGEGLRV